MTPEEVRHVAMLARLGLTESEVEALRAQLLDVLNYIAVLEKVDTSSIPPTAQVLTHLNVIRADEARPSLPVDLLLSNAPAKQGNFFMVPAVLEDFKEGKGEAVADAEEESIV